MCLTASVPSFVCFLLANEFAHGARTHRCSAQQALIFSASSLRLWHSATPAFGHFGVRVPARWVLLAHFVLLVC
jgi:hypothetical protein